MVWNAFFVFIYSVSWFNSVEGQYLPPRGSSVWGYFTPPVLQRVPLESHQAAMEAMVDLTNNLGIAILQDHSFSRGNFAFSPYGVASVLVVLYEGARGESAQQIHRAIRFPLDKDIIRIGFRDIHRHLRSYFSHEGYLSGISLNKESSSLKPEYKKILRFYGYDVELTQPLGEEDAAFETSPSAEVEAIKITGFTPQAPPRSTSLMYDKDKEVTSEKNSSESEKTDKKTTLRLEDSTEVTEAILSEATQPVESTTELETKESTEIKTTVSAFPLITTTTEILEENVTDSLVKDEKVENNDEYKPTLKEIETVTTISTILTAGTETENKVIAITAKPLVITEKENDEFQINLTIENNANCKGIAIKENEEEEKCAEVEQNTTKAFELNRAVTEKPDVNEKVLTNAITFSSNSLNGHHLTESEAKTTESDDSEIIKNLDNGMLIPQPENRDMPTADSLVTESKWSSTKLPFTMETVTEVLEAITEVEKSRNGSSLVRDKNKNLTGTSTKIKENEERSVKNIRSMIDTKVSLWLSKPKKKPNPRRVRTITDYLKSPHNPDLSLQLQNGMYDTHVSRNADLYRSLPRLLFLVDGAVDTPVPMMTFTNVFPYAYIPRLHSKVLEFPLDDVRYKLLILLPVERRGLRQLIYDLVNYPLSNVLKSTRPSRVKAVVPTFMVEGFVILTSSLQKLGIWDVFDPRKANLSGMSMDPELYVRNVEQSVTVVIRNYVEILDIQTRTMAARQMEYEFEATHPFLYFVLDTATNIALMTGQILDPLNSRIY